MPQAPGSSVGSDRAQSIAWRAWGRAAFEEAVAGDRPVLLSLVAAWCQACKRMDETTYADPALVALIEEAFVPIRVDADRYPLVQERYIAGGWPTNAFLTPTGEVLWAGTFVEPAPFAEVARNIRSAWATQRQHLAVEIERRRKAMETARSRFPTTALVRREAADDVLTGVQQAFDARNGGFGDSPKFPYPDVLELLFVQARRTGDDAWRHMAEQSLDGMMAGALWDEADGGFFRYALRADWTKPRHEKLLETNAALLRAYALGAGLTGREDWRRIAERTVDFVEGWLRREDGLWGGALAAVDDYYALPAEERASAPRPEPDLTLFTDSCSHWIRALAIAGGRLGRPDWIQRAADALPLLLERMAARDGLLFHFAAPGEAPELPGLLTDALEAARAAMALHQATGREEFLAEARRLASAMQARLWVDAGGLEDHVASGEDVAALRYRDRPFELNADAARLLLDLYVATGDRSYRGMAERILAVFSPMAGRHEVAGSAFALAVDEFFEPPLLVVVVGEPERSEALRLAGLALDEPDRRVFTLPAGGRLAGRTFPAAPAPAAYVCGHHGATPALEDPALLAEAARQVR